MVSTHDFHDKSNTVWMTFSFNRENKSSTANCEVQTSFGAYIEAFLSSKKWHKI